MTTENERLRELLRECSECLSRHMTGVNCHGPRLSEDAIARLRAERLGEGGR
jgi:hypothetical protein